jgi:hypothetical protein
VSRGMALAAYVAVGAASVLLWAFGKAVAGWAP